MTEIREEMIDLIKANLIGPNPKEGFTQDNGQEILFFESPLQTYVAGILFPQILEPEFIQDEEILTIAILLKLMNIRKPKVLLVIQSFIQNQ